MSLPNPKLAIEVKLQIELGRFDTIEGAIAARLQAEEEYGYVSDRLTGGLNLSDFKHDSSENYE